MKMTTASGAALAAAAFSLAIGTATLVTPASAGSLVMCFGVNACKGQGACKGGSHSCKGQNACKGQGWINASAEQCQAWGGKIEG